MMKGDGLRLREVQPVFLSETERFFYIYQKYLKRLYNFY